MRLRQYHYRASLLLGAITLGLVISQGRSSRAVGPQRVRLYSTGRRSTTAIVGGAGLAPRVMRILPGGTPVDVDLAAGRLRVISLSIRSVRLEASNVSSGLPGIAPANHLMARGHVVSLRANTGAAGVTAWF